MTTREPGPRDVFTHGLRFKPFSIAFFASKPAPIRTFGLDRVYEPYLLASKFYLKPSFDAEKHFKNVYGVYPLSKKEEKIIFRITPSLSDYLISQPIHDSQKVEKYHPRGSLTLSVKLIVSQELINFFQMRRDDLEVFEPKWLVDKLYRK